MTLKMYPTIVRPVCEVGKLTILSLTDKNEKLQAVDVLYMLKMGYFSLLLGGC